MRQPPAAPAPAAWCQHGMLPAEQALHRMHRSLATQASSARACLRHQRQTPHRHASPSRRQPALPRLPQRPPLPPCSPPPLPGPAWGPLRPAPPRHWQRPLLAVCSSRQQRSRPPGWERPWCTAPLPAWPRGRAARQARLQARPTAAATTWLRWTAPSPTPLRRPRRRWRSRSSGRSGAPTRRRRRPRRPRSRSCCSRYVPCAALFCRCSMFGSSCRQISKRVHPPSSPSPFGARCGILDSKILPLFVSSPRAGPGRGVRRRRPRPRVGRAAGRPGRAPAGGGSSGGTGAIAQPFWSLRMGVADKGLCMGRGVLHRSGDCMTSSQHPRACAPCTHAGSGAAGAERARARRGHPLPHRGHRLPVGRRRAGQGAARRGAVQAGAALWCCFIYVGVTMGSGRGEIPEQRDAGG